MDNPEYSGLLSKGFKWDFKNIIWLIIMGSIWIRYYLFYFDVKCTPYVMFYGVREEWI
jgi:hypothetical protein